MGASQQVIATMPSPNRSAENIASTHLLPDAAAKLLAWRPRPALMHAVHRAATVAFTMDSHAESSLARLDQSSYGMNLLTDELQSNPWLADFLKARGLTTHDLRVGDVWRLHVIMRDARAADDESAQLTESAHRLARAMKGRGTDERASDGSFTAQAPGNPAENSARTADGSPPRRRGP